MTTHTTSETTIDTPDPRAARTNAEVLDYRTPARSPSGDESVAVTDFARAIGSLDVRTLRDHHLAIAMAVIEFAADAEAPLPWSHDDPTVALLRATAKLALTAPASRSNAAADLLDRLRTIASVTDTAG